MSRIKTRERVKDIKLLDKSAVVGQRMKNAFIRSRRNAAALTDERQASPSEYAGNNVQFAADDLLHDTANVAVSGTKSVVRQGKKLFQQQREKQAAKARQNAADPSQQPAPQTEAPGRLPGGRPVNTDPAGKLPRQRGDMAPEPPTGQRRGVLWERRRPAPPGDRRRAIDTADPVVERGRTFAKKQSAKRADAKRQVTGRSVRSDPLPRRVDQPLPPAEPIKRATRPVQQTIKTIGKGAETATKGAVKTAQRLVKTAGRTAKGVTKTAGHTAKTSIKTAEHTAKAAQKTAQATARAVQVAAHTARATARAAALAAKATAKAVAATVKAIILATKALIAAIAAGGWVAVLAIVIICLIGLIVASAFGIFFSGEDSGTGQTMTSAVREINQEYGDRLGAIKTENPHEVLEMSGSRAVWREVLAVYAVKTTTDPDSPQEVATMDDAKKELLKDIFWSMNEISHRMETATTTQTVESDDGKGNIIVEEVEVTATTLYITVTHKTADEMADVYNFTTDQRERLVELLAEDNNSLWNAALYGIGAGDGEIISVALSQLGNVGGDPYWSWYGFESRVDWCACFVSWCANECGYLDAGVIPRFAGCGLGAQWFMDRGLWQNNDFVPRPGDIIFFDWDDEDGQDGAPDHVGIVERVDGGVVCTVEGNSGDSCKHNSYSVGHYEIYGYGTPAY